jgi:CRISPR-associated protein Csd1
LQREQNDPAFEKKRVSYLLEIGWDGTFLGVTDCHGPIQPDQTERQPAPALLAPRSPGHRTGGVYPLLACDNAGYVLGFDRKHDAFVALLEEAAEATSDPALRSCVAFFRCPDGLSSARKCLATFNPPPGAWIALSVGGPVINRKVVRAYWRQTYARESHAMTESGRESMCLISGQIGPIARTHLKVKGITAVGGNPTGVSFASFGKKAHRSYGWRQAENSPVLPDRANAYILALNHLLKGGKRSRVDHGGVSFVSWTRIPVSATPVLAIEDPRRAPIEPLLELYEDRRRRAPNDLYLLGISGNQGRLIVRCWIQQDLEAVLGNVAVWFRSLGISDPFTGTLGEPPGIPRVLASISLGATPPEWPIKLLRRALLGEPLDASMLAAALRARHVATGCDALSPARAGLIRMCLNDREGSNGIPAMLDPTLRHPAYRLGRLLALCDALQHQLRRRTDISVSDQYYRLISICPMASMPRLREISRSFRSQLRLYYPGKVSRIAADILAIEEALDRAGVPSVLSLEDQAFLALGFHHQCAGNTARSIARGRERPDRKAQRHGDA